MSIMPGYWKNKVNAIALCQGTLTGGGLTPRLADHLMTEWLPLMINAPL
jgi:hypothetical protein